MNSHANDTAYFCPECGSADVEVPLLEGSAASCAVCKWKGPRHELAGVQFSHEFASQEEVARHFFLDIRQLLSKSLAIDIGRLLLKWGFLETAEPKLLARYVSAVAKGIANGILDERRAIEKERVHGSA